MSDIAIRVENLSKQYRIGGPQARYKTLRESLTEAVQSPFRRLSSVVRGQSSAVSNETIWALKDVSFEVKRGEVVGIIGRNGAGKTTLLKILSRITEPTEGYAEIHGRVGSLLEVGTGFHPELTGRENIYLNGAILGMRRAEIERKFDEMVDFAEIEKFMDTPVKHYSSGMYVRLAFAVAAHLEPEILLVDEVLAVGDAAFQKKCLGKMGDVARQGRTVLFVSHNMGMISSLCGRCILLKDGRILSAGDVGDVVQLYLEDSSTSGASFFNEDRNIAAKEVVLISAEIRDSEQNVVSTLKYHCLIVVHLAYEVTEDIHDLRVGFYLFNATGICVFASHDGDSDRYAGSLRRRGRYEAICVIPPAILRPGDYFLTLHCGIVNQKTVFRYENALSFRISEADVGLGLARRPPGVIMPKLRWTVRQIGKSE